MPRNALQNNPGGLLGQTEMRPTPRNALLGAIADALQAGKGFANKAQIPAGVPLLGGQGLGDVLLGQAPQELSEWSYGNAPMRINPNAGRTASFVPEVKPGRKQGFADMLGLATTTPGRNALMMGMGGIADGGAERAAIAALQNSARSAKMRAPQQVKEVGFWDEYKGIKPGAASGERPMADIDGRAIDPRAAIAGRATVDGDSVGLTNEQVDSIVQQLGIGIRGVPAREIGGDAGRYVVDGGQRSILLDRNLVADQLPHVMRHELGHAVDDFAGVYKPGQIAAIPPDGHSNALAHIYDDLNSRMGPSPVGVTRPPKMKHTPAADKYKKGDHAAERMAEAIRAYITNPAYIKTAAPELAARLRKAVNENPNLRKILVLNSAAGAAVLGAPYAGDGPD